ncbi:MAG: ion channel [Pseudoxanthomonas sp.]
MATRAFIWLLRLRRHPAGLLLTVQLIGVMLYPLMEDTPLGRALFGAFGIVVLSLVLWVVYRRSASRFAWLLAAPAVALSLSASFLHLPGLLPFAQALESALYFYAAAGLMFYMLEDHVITFDELIAAGAAFTLLAWAFAYAFSACQFWSPGSFSGAVDPTHARSWLELLFLSFSLLSGVGLSDIAPVLPGARALSMLAMFSGVMYIAIVVSRVIALTAARRPQA